MLLKNRSLPAIAKNISDKLSVEKDLSLSSIKNIICASLGEKDTYSFNKKTIS